MQISHIPPQLLLPLVIITKGSKRQNTLMCPYVGNLDKKGWGKRRYFRSAAESETAVLAQPVSKKGKKGKEAVASH